MDEATRKAAHTLLDFYAGYVGSETDQERLSAFETSVASLNEAEAVVASRDPNGDLVLDFTPMLIASGITYQWLFGQLSAATGRPEEEITFELRGFIEGLG